MGREIRMVPPNFELPMDDEAEYIPMRLHTYQYYLEQWQAEKE